MNAFVWAILAACVWGFVPVFEKLGLSKVSPYVGLFYRCFGVLIGLVILRVFIVKPVEIKAVDARTVFLLVLSGFLASFLAQIFFYHGLKIGEVSRLVPIAGSFPLITFLLGIFLLGEAVTVSKVVGVLMIGTGIWLLK